LRGNWEQLSRSHSNKIIIAAAPRAAAPRDLAELYALGWGVSQDVREAIKWWAKAATKGEEAAITNLRRHASAGVPEASAALRRLRLAPCSCAPFRLCGRSAVRAWLSEGRGGGAQQTTCVQPAAHRIAYSTWS
jgi:TPR repeat protein